ncbi:C40 family peptidase [Hymenobacter rubidus]|uniref:C40 family peptidase n=1 Tax=Hymenobacter rubidus TaxID=1441626 RepID=UPI00191D1848|nr:C40 family peptidase [Hymenobacter rubidus]
MALLLPRFRKRADPPAKMPVPHTVALVPETSLQRRQLARADSIVAFGLAQQGTPYVYAGTSPLTGFDCSGFIMYTFAHFGLAVPHSTALLIDVGRPVARTDAQPGDIVVFTGTAKTSTTPGHAGIVISGRGEVPLRFVHASSSRREPFVKVSQVEDSDYERRFMQVRRVLGPGEIATSRPKVPIPASTAVPVAKLPARTVPLAFSELPIPALPRKLPAKKYGGKKIATHTTVRKKSATKPAARKKPLASKPKVGKKPTTATRSKKPTVKTASHHR